MENDKELEEMYSQINQLKVENHKLVQQNEYMQQDIENLSRDKNQQIINFKDQYES